MPIIMVKKSKITEDEITEFHEAMKGSAPIKQTRRKPTKKPVIKRKSTEHHYPERKYYRDDYEKVAPKDRVGGEDVLHYSQAGIQLRLLQKLKRGQVALEASLDLHGLTFSEAHSAVEDFIADCQARKLRCVLLIHGKGSFSRDDTPILKNQVNQWLRGHSQVLAFHSAQAKDGGKGAVYVLLKRK